MSEKAGKNLILKVDVGGSSFSMLGGLQSNEQSLSAEAIDVTHKGSSGLWKTLLEGAGVKSMTVSGKGIHNGDASTLGLVEQALIDRSLVAFQIVDVDDNGSALKTYAGNFMVNEFTRSGDLGAGQEYSISIESSGEITIS